MSFKRFVETGRVAYIVDGEHRGKLCAIVDIIDQTRVLVDGPHTGVPRQGIRINQINLTKFRIKIPRSGSTNIVRKTWSAAKIHSQWKKSVWAKNIEKKKKRLAMTDFDRFRLRLAVAKRNEIRSEAFFVLRKQAIRKNRLFGMKKTKKSEGERESAKKKSDARNRRLAYQKKKLVEKGLWKPREKTEKESERAQARAKRRAAARAKARAAKPKAKPTGKPEKPKEKQEKPKEKQDKPKEKQEKPKEKQEKPKEKKEKPKEAPKK